MNADNAILWPMGALVALTFAVLLLVPIRRFRAAFARQVTAADFRYGESANVPGDVAIPNRNYMNLLESPVLFYVACLTVYVTHRVDTVFVALAWIYVAARAAHSVVHLTYNNVMHRLAFFGAGLLVLIAMWARFFLIL
ncbi:MAG TPA: MAPEG family protein [Usitatibacter sp.]|nr:MAPEG family protein [Usitatibacter sp.]